MKPILLLFPIVMLFIIGCQEEEMLASKQVTFTAPISSGSSSEDQTLSLELSVTDAYSNSVVINQHIELTSIEGQIVTHGINLPAGKYVINDFLISNAEGKVVYALPRKESNLGRGRDMSDHSFIVSDAAPNEITVNVLEVEGRRVQDFGYEPAKFKTYSFKAIVSVMEDDRLRPTDASAYIQSEDGETYQYDLDARVNTLTFAGDPLKEYNLLVWKDGYKVYSQPFIYNDLRAEQHGKPLEIVLEPEIASAGNEVSFQPGDDYFSMWIEVSGQGMIVLDWGNGETESLMFNVDPENMTGTGYFSREHQYDGTRSPIRLSGDIHLITALFFDTSVSTVDLEHASALRGITFSGSQLASLNLAKNENLQWMSFFNSVVENLTLPAQHGINNIMIESDGTWPTASQLESILENIHANTETKNIVDGYCSFNVNEVSDNSTALLRDLKDNFNWEVYY